MMNDEFSSFLEGFSRWTLELLPRLFLYPGGLWALVALLVLRLASGGVNAIRPRSLAADLLRAPLLPTGCAWVAMALLPLPASGPLWYPADRLVLAGLLLTSLVLDQAPSSEYRVPSTEFQDTTLATRYSLLATHVEVAIALAILAPLASGQALLSAPLNRGAPGWLALGAVVVGLCAISNSTTLTLPGALRWLAWLGLAADEFWASIDSQPEWFWLGAASLAYAFAIATIAGAGRLAVVRRNRTAMLAICWGLAALALVWALAT
jgi:hypothetical protein